MSGHACLCQLSSQPKASEICGQKGIMASDDLTMHACTFAWMSLIGPVGLLKQPPSCLSTDYSWHGALAGNYRDE
jgi:hypothetical protein